MNEPGPYILIQDDDGHWYVCPASKEDEAAAYFRAVEDYWTPGSDPDTDAPEEPEWLDQVGGAPSLVLFTGYSIKR